MRTLEKMESQTAGEKFHIYTLSRVFRINAPKWEPILEELEEDREVMRSVYAPLRLAINAELAMPESGRTVLEHALSSMGDTPSLRSVKDTSREEFETFRQTIAPKIAKIEADFVTGRVPAIRFTFGDYLLQGAFHAKVQLNNGAEKYLYVHPSKAWSENQKVAFIELLAIMGEQHFECDRDDIWFLDLQTSEIRQPSKTFKAIRKELLQTLAHLARFR